MRSIVGSNEGSEGSILPPPCTLTLGMQLEVCGLATDCTHFSDQARETLNLAVCLSVPW